MIKLFAWLWKNKSKPTTRSDHTVEKFLYSDGTTPDGYVCDDCGASGVRLYRLYNAFLDCQHFRCRACTIKDQGKEALKLNEELHLPEHAIGWLIAAVPTENGETFWGYSSVPDAGVAWWDNLPKE